MNRRSYWTMSWQRKPCSEVWASIFGFRFALQCHLHIHQGLQNKTCQSLKRKEISTNSEREISLVTLSTHTNGECISFHTVLPLEPDGTVDGSFTGIAWLAACELLSKWDKLQRCEFTGLKSFSVLKNCLSSEHAGRKLCLRPPFAFLW